MVALAALLFVDDTLHNRLITLVVGVELYFVRQFVVHADDMKYNYKMCQLLTLIASKKMHNLTYKERDDYIELVIILNHKCLESLLFCYWGGLC